MRGSATSAKHVRIGFDLRRMHKTGIGRYARNIFAAVAAEAPEHEYVAVVQSEADAAWARAAAPAALAVVAPASQYSPREMIRTPALTPPVDLWHSPHPYQWAIGAGHRTVLTLLDLIQVQHAVGLVNALAREPLRAIIWGACRRADRFVAISAATRDVFHQEMGVPLDRIHVTPLAPDPRFADPVDVSRVEDARVRWRLSERALVYVGMTQPHKNLDGLLRALALLAQDCPTDSVTLAIIGPEVPTQRATLLARAQALGVSDRIRLLGWLPDDEVRLAYHLASAVVLPSLAEGFGLTMLEAMQCGAPCVASDIPALREVVEQGGNALLVEPCNPGELARAIATLLDDPERARAFGARSRRIFEQRFQLERSVERSVASYRRIVAAKRKLDS
jgi:glycosyltransferase involved in cell wall biosynthesis